MSNDRDFSLFTSSPTSALPYRARPDVVVSITPEKGGESQYFLKSVGGELFEFREQEHFLWKALNGTSSFADIAQAFRARFSQEIQAADFAEFMRELAASALIEHGVNAPETAEKPPRRIDLAYVRDEPIEYEANAQSEPAPPEERRWREPMSFVLFNPNRLLRVLAFMFRPFHVLAWLIVPFAFFASLIVLHRFAEYQLHFHSLLLLVPFWPALLIGELILNMLVRIVQGAVIRGHGGEVRQFIVRFVTGWWPRFNIDESAVPHLSKHARLWLHASALLTYLATFAIGTTIWGVYRRSDTMLADIGLGFGQLGIWIFVFRAFPLFPLDGYRWLATAVDQPRLRDRAIQFLGMRMKGRAAPETMTSYDRWGLALFGAGTVICTTIWVGWVVTMFSSTVVSEFRGLGFVVLMVLFSISVLYILAVRRTAKQRDALHRAERSAHARRLAIGLEPRPGN
jgi:hypothetical protein